MFNNYLIADSAPACVILGRFVYMCYVFSFMENQLRKSVAYSRPQRQQFRVFPVGSAIRTGSQALQLVYSTFL